MNTHSSYPTSRKLLTRFSATAKEITRHFNAHGFALYAVGGAVRDALMGREIHDIDFTTDAMPHDVMRICKRTIPTGIKHGTITVLWSNSNPGGALSRHQHTFEITTYRADGTYANHRHPDSVRFTPSLEEDLKRRDFTINALAFDAASGGLHDPFCGQQDIQNKTIRCVGNARTRFTEDALRMLRCIRFAVTLNFTIENKTLKAISQCAELTTRLSKERIYAEFTKMLTSARPHGAYKLLSDTTLLQHTLPGLHFDSDCFKLLRQLSTGLTNSMVENSSMRAALAYASLLFSLQHKMNPTKAAQRAEHVYTELRMPKKILAVVKTILNHSEISPCKNRVENFKSRLRLLAACIGVPQTRVLIMFAAMRADMSNHREINLKNAVRYLDTYERNHPIQNPADVQLDSARFLKETGASPGKWLGILKKTLMRYVCVHPEKNTPEFLNQYAKSLRIIGSTTKS